MSSVSISISKQLSAQPRVSSVAHGVAETTRKGGSPEIAKTPTTQAKDLAGPHGKRSTSLDLRGHTRPHCAAPTGFEHLECRRATNCCTQGTPGPPAGSPENVMRSGQRQLDLVRAPCTKRPRLLRGVEAQSQVPRPISSVPGILTSYQVPDVIPWDFPHAALRCPDGRTYALPCGYPTARNPYSVVGGQPAVYVGGVVLRKTHQIRRQSTHDIRRWILSARRLGAKRVTTMPSKVDPIPLNREGVTSIHFGKSKALKAWCDEACTPYLFDIIKKNPVLPYTSWGLFSRAGSHGIGFIIPSTRELTETLVSRGVPVPAADALVRSTREHYDHYWSRIGRSTRGQNPWIAMSDAQLLELLLILCGDVELNPGPAFGKKEMRDAVQASKDIACALRDANRERARSSSPRVQHNDGRRFAQIDPPAVEGGGAVPKPAEARHHEFEVGEIFYLEHLPRRETLSGTYVEFERCRVGQEMQFKVKRIFEEDPFRLVLGVTNGPYSVREVELTAQELNVANELSIFASPTQTYSNLLRGLRRVHDKECVNIRTNSTKVFALMAIAAPHKGSDLRPYDDLVVELEKLPWKYDPNGERIDFDYLEKLGFVFQKSLVESSARFVRSVHAAPYRFDAPLNMSDPGHEPTAAQSIVKRLSPALPARVNKDFEDDVKTTVDALSEIIMGNVRGNMDQPDDIPTARELVMKYCEGKGSDVRDVAEEVLAAYEADDPHAWIELRREYEEKPVRFFFKREVNSTPKPVRFIACRDVKYRVMQIICLGPTLWLIEKGTTEANVKGLNPQQIREKLIQKASEFETMFETDYTSFESLLTWHVRSILENRLFAHLVRSWDMGPDAAWMVGMCRKKFLKVSCREGGWFCNKFPSIRLSGDQWTSIGNLVSNIVLSYVTLKECSIRTGQSAFVNECLGEGGVITVQGLRAFLRYSLFEGDDGVFPTFGLDPKEVAKSGRNNGLLYKVEQGRWEELSFCGNRLEVMSNGEFVRVRDAAKVLASFSVLFATGIPCGPHSEQARALQRAKALSFLMGDVVPDLTSLALMLEGLTRGAECTPELHMKAYGAISEWVPFHAEGCLKYHADPLIRHILDCAVGSNSWFDALVAINRDGQLGYAELRDIFYQLRDSHVAQVPGFIGDSFVASPSHAMQVNERDRPLQNLAARQNFLAGRRRHIITRLKRGIIDPAPQPPSLLHYLLVCMALCVLFDVVALYAFPAEFNHAVWFVTHWMKGALRLLGRVAVGLWTLVFGPAAQPLF